MPKALSFTPDVVVYHDQCNDGLCAAAIAYGVFGDTPIYVPMQYQTPVPAVIEKGGRGILFLDFVPYREIFDSFIGRWDNWFVIDHHADHSWILERGPNVVFGLDHSAAWLTWDVLGAKGYKRPKLVDYVQDRDLWKWALPNSREISAAIMEWRKFTPSQWWDALADTEVDGLDALIDKGTTILDVHQAIATSAAKKSVRVVLHDTNVRMVNCTTLISETCNAILDLYDDVDVAVGFFFVGDDKVVMSFRSRPGVACNTLAQAVSDQGGGHPQAAGASVSVEEFFKLLEVL